MRPTLPRPSHWLRNPERYPDARLAHPSLASSTSALVTTSSGIHRSATSESRQTSRNPRRLGVRDHWRPTIIEEKPEKRRHEQRVVHPGDRATQLHLVDHWFASWSIRVGHSEGKS